MTNFFQLMKKEGKKIKKKSLDNLFESEKISNLKNEEKLKKKIVLRVI